MPTPPSFTLRYLGGASALLDFGGVTFLLDPTFDAPGEHPVGERVLVRTEAPAAGPDEVGAVDVVLLSHDQHPDNLDRGGREYLDTARLVLSTASAEQRIGGAVQALPNWLSTEFDRPEGGTVVVTGVPALHGPEDSEPVVGEVTGFVLSGEELPTVYVSGDNASLDLVRKIGERLGPIDVAVLNAGGARTALMGEEYLTLPSPDAAEAARILGSGVVIPLHFEHWTHFSQDADSLVAAFAAAGLEDRLRMLKPGDSTSA